MRTDQMIGLNHRAIEMVKGDSTPVTVTEIVEFPDGRKVQTVREETRSNIVSSVYRIQDGAWNEGFVRLQKYVFPYNPSIDDERVLWEDIQAIPWSSGPCYFLALKDEQGWVEESLWTEEEITKRKMGLIEENAGKWNNSPQSYEEWDKKAKLSVGAWKQ